MYIAIYVSAIVLVCVGAITFFIVKDQRNKKLAEKLKKQAKEETATVSNGVVKNGDYAAKGENSKTKTDDEFAQHDIGTLPQEQTGLEDFSLQFENEKKKPKPSFDLNPFNLDGGFTGHAGKSENDEVDFDDFDLDDENFGQNDDGNDDDLDKKFKEYEEFLRRNLDLDDEDLEDDDFLKDVEGNENDDKVAPAPTFNNSKSPSAADMRALQNFDYDSLRGKSEEEIAEIIKSLPPKAQEILMSDILARRNFEDEE